MCARYSSFMHAWPHACINDWTDKKQVETLEKAAKAYVDALWTQIHYMIGLSVSPSMIAFYGGDLKKYKSKIDKNFQSDSWAAKYNMLQLGRLVKLLKALNSDDDLIDAVILEDEHAMNMSVEKPSKFESA